jgi:acylphosphatase
MIEISSFSIFLPLHLKINRSTLPHQMNARVHIVVRGMVQGVGFRYFVFRLAQSMHLNGFAQNLFSGDVEIEVEGNRGLIEEFIKEVKVGPRHAAVEDLVIEWKDSTLRYSNFEIR